MNDPIKKPLTLEALQTMNTRRAMRWHKAGLEEWSPLEWAGAMCGEAGEAANAAKKLKRLTSGMRNINTEEGREALDTIAKAKLKVAWECADTIIYGVLLMAEMGMDADEMVREVFNTKSEEYGYPERI